MPVQAAQLEVEDESVALNVAGDTRRVRLAIKNMSAEPAYLGPDDVADDTGYELAESEQLVVELAPGDVLYAVSTATGTTLSVLRS